MHTQYAVIVNLATGNSSNFYLLKRIDFEVLLSVKK